MHLPASRCTFTPISIHFTHSFTLSMHLQAPVLFQVCAFQTPPPSSWLCDFGDDGRVRFRRGGGRQLAYSLLSPVRLPLLIWAVGAREPFASAPKPPPPVFLRIVSEGQRERRHLTLPLIEKVLRRLNRCSGDDVALPFAKALTAGLADTRGIEGGEGGRSDAHRPDPMGEMWVRGSDSKPMATSLTGN